MKQYDSRWAGYKWHGDTIGASGCGPTAVANIVSALKKSVTPKDVFKFLCKKGYFYPNQGTAWAGITAALKHYGINDFKVTSSGDAAKTALKKGHWLIGIVTKSRWTHGGHFIVLYGITKSGHVLVSDSASNSDYRQKDGTFAEYRKAECNQWLDIDPKRYKKAGTPVKKATPTPKKDTHKYVFYISDKYANVRKGRSTQYGVKGVLNRNDKVILTNFKGDWYQIASGKFAGGFLHKSVLSKYAGIDRTYQTLEEMNVRDGYTTKGTKVLKTFKKGTKFKATKKRGDWVYCPAVKGWVCVKCGNETYLKQI